MRVDSWEGGREPVVKMNRVDTWRRLRTPAMYDRYVSSRRGMGLINDDSEWSVLAKLIDEVNVSSVITEGHND